ncbi:MAG: F0F1 ATP synthase subunit A [Lachnospiraceae bacterium]|nr:F0F1 ATP synthase subunit A [Lachnospiraceae bacterium]
MNNAVLLASADDIDFMIHGLFSYELFGQTVWITTSHVCIAIVMMVLIILAIIANRKMAKATEVPDTLQNVIEIVVEFLDGIVKGSMGWSAPKFRNYIGTIFLFILLSNISGIFGLRPPTADYGTTFALGVITFSLIHINQFRYNSLKQIWTDMCSPLPPWLPIWLPINLISEIAVPISLSLRLFANVLSGTVMMALVYGLLKAIAYVWPAALHVYFDLFSGAIQTYVFCMLTMTYISQQMGEEPIKQQN